MKRLLRRMGLLGQSQAVNRQIKEHKERQKQQLSLLEGLAKRTDRALLKLPLRQLAKVNSEEVFNTFAARCLDPKIRNLEALADVNIERVLSRSAHRCIPFTVKDHLKVDGLVQTLGFADNIVPSEESCQIVQMLEKEGCIAYAHSNIPQGMLGIESTSIFGTSRNPHNPEFVSGGSSGGEGALVASKVNGFGLGSDTGGSVRIPAAFSGVYGFKPTGSKRFSAEGRIGSSGKQGLKVGDLDPCMGFLTRSVDDMAWLCQKTVGKRLKPTSPLMYGGEWSDSRYEAAKRRKLRVGYICDYDQMKLAPGLRNTIMETVAKLEQNKHTVVKFEFDKVSKFRDYFFEYIHQTGFNEPNYQRLEEYKVPDHMRKFYDMRLFGESGNKWRSMWNKDPSVHKMEQMHTTTPSLARFMAIHREVDTLRKQFQAEWERLELDVLLTPVMPFTAILPNTSQLPVFQLSFCCFQNVMEQPAGSIPTRRVLPNQTEYVPTNAMERAVAESIHRSEGLPLSVQVTGRHLQDEECLGAIWQINRLNGQYLDPFQN